MSPSRSDACDKVQRSAPAYSLGFEGAPEEAPFYRYALALDSKAGELGELLMAEANRRAAKDPELSAIALLNPSPRALPRVIVVIDASNDGLPTGPESHRVFAAAAADAGIPAPVVLVQTRDELMQAIGDDAAHALVLSQCVDARVYNTELAAELKAMGVVVFPGAVTAPGGVFSDKGATYDMLRRDGHDELVADYEVIHAPERTTTQVVEAILDAAERRFEANGNARFYVKPVTGGSGVGGFRLRLTPEGFFVPDLSKLTGDAGVPHPVPLDVSPDDDARIDELVWIFETFEADPYYKKQYVHVGLGELQERYGAENSREALRSHLRATAPQHEERSHSRSHAREDMVERLTAAVLAYEARFSKRYEPVVCDFIDFGAWGLRAHYRLTRRGVEIETLYARIFQMALTEEGVGYVGADNISNKHTGQLEPLRLTPIQAPMVRAVGGGEAFLRLLDVGARATASLVHSQPKRRQRLVPMRCQIDIAPISAKLGEGNADTARGQVIGTRWPTFKTNMREWFLDCIAAYGEVKGR